MAGTMNVVVLWDAILYSSGMFTDISDEHSPSILGAADGETFLRNIGKYLTENTARHPSIWLSSNA
jgi:hypothetical protein